MASPISKCDLEILAENYHIVEDSWRTLNRIRNKVIVTSRESGYEDDFVIIGNVRSIVTARRVSLNISAYADDLGLTDDELIEIISKFLFFVEDDELPTRDEVSARAEGCV